MFSFKLLAKDKPRHLLGIGEIVDIFEVVKRGIDLFDCVTNTPGTNRQAFFKKSGKISNSYP
ncbi:MAG: tRNA-guanine transglycosylase [Deltaproteobacteria bacterium]|nr:tRNA-guanine transglycosylase [Deltaproteobacteria bacterium]